jgi:hypothetical protein|tara:strand:+ start:307 stop:522 length:216 start_codon:yes stop_codon:yes gene_type:complete
MDIDRIINIVREMTTLSGGGATAAKPGFSGKSDREGPVAGYDPAMDLRKRYGRKLNPFYRKALKNVRGHKK